MLSVFVAIRLHSAVSAPLSEEKENASAVILIDPGHGGEDGGASADGTLEKDVNLKISLTLADMLRLCGYKIKLTRDGDYSIYDAGLNTIREQKNSDLKNRLKLYNDCRLAIGIHQNHFTQSQYYGTQIFYGINNSESMPLAKSIRESVLGMLQPENKRELKKATKDIYLLYNTNSPAIFVECGFLSNPGELAKLRDTGYQQKMAYAITCGVLAYGP
ncbi:Germination-specific N-acetylmuramoyl-L-alanine amidase [bioreactor metagenome]|uniref:Germination-specific N-acetylmuramoyl-L-alanine amidase n=1 Tax=bioreactor metagenome TaxID=1076179 RepID=A0A645HFZ0_9ZZZZ